MFIDERLYLPQKWIDDEERCSKAKIPHEEVKFRTKYEHALEMIDNAITEGIPFPMSQWMDSTVKILSY